MRLGQAHLPRQTRILDRRRGRSARAAVMARDQDHVGLRLGHTGGDGADARGRHQLHRDLGARVDLLEVVDQLRQVLDRVDVVMRRRRDQRHALRRMPQPRDQLRDLHAGQLPALAGLGALRDLDLKLLAVVEVFRRHAEAARGHLLDLGRGLSPLGSGTKCAGSSPPSPESDFAPIRFIATFSVLCASGERAKRHARRHEPLADRGDAFDLLDRDRGAPSGLMSRRSRRWIGGFAASWPNTASTARRTPCCRPSAACASSALPRRVSRPTARLVEAADRQTPPARAASRARAPPPPSSAGRDADARNAADVMPGKNSATIARDSPTASKFRPPR
jgi:hypothetical protein